MRYLNRKVIPEGQGETRSERDTQMFQLIASIIKESRIVRIVHPDKLEHLSREISIENMYSREIIVIQNKS